MVGKNVIKTQINSAYIINTSLDGCSFYVGCLCASLLFGVHPLNKLEDIRVGSLFYKHIPERITGSACIYLLLMIQFLISKSLHASNMYHYLKHFIFQFVIYITTFTIIVLKLCERKSFQIQMFKQLSYFNQQYLLLGENIIALMQESIGDIKIGPENRVIVLLVGTGAFAVIFKAIQFIDYCTRDMYNLFVFQ
ncbi:Hypothetical_protein [Hexamita inflata]|uniref:Hypothetical_protein n=1 Tax=Hexamita inflata TaxID=28002 RepID=A0AA86P517_9EUKA|nr:Hypothetical protein HINF_LOCUS20022 [Hexamita inflata]